MKHKMAREDWLKTVDSQQKTLEPAFRSSSPQPRCSRINNSKKRNKQRTLEPALQVSSSQPGRLGINNSPIISVFEVSREFILLLYKELRSTQRVKNAAEKKRL